MADGPLVIALLLVSYFERQCICFDVLLNLIICNAQSNTDFNFHENLYKHINKIVLPINYINCMHFMGSLKLLS